MGLKKTHGVATRTLRAILWSYGTYLGGLSISLLVLAILARLLTPEDFGLIALALIGMAILDTFPGLGVGEALIVVPEEDLEEKAETAFAVSVLVGFVLAAILAALGPIAASFFQQPELVEVMPVLGASFILLGFGITHGAIAQKRLDFRARNLASLADAISRGVVGVTLALTGAGVWSLVFGYLAGSAASTIALWLLVPWRPRLRPRRAHLRDLLGFGGTLTGVGVMAAFVTQFDFLVIGRVLGATSLAFYSMATRLPGYAILGLAAVVSRVLFPAFASLQQEDMPRACVRAFRYTALVVLPLAVFLGVLAEPLTLALFGDQWGASVGALQVLCVWAGASTFLYVAGSAFKARKRADIVFKLAVPQAVGLVVGSLALVRYGIVAVSWVQASIAMCALIGSIAIARRLFGFTLREFAAAIGPSTIAATVLGFALWVVSRAVSSTWPTILVGGAVGLAVYGSLIVLLARQSLVEMKATAFPPRSAQQPIDEALERSLEAAERAAPP